MYSTNYLAPKLQVFGKCFASSSAFVGWQGLPFTFGSIWHTLTPTPSPSHQETQKKLHQPTECNDNCVQLHLSRLQHFPSLQAYVKWRHKFLGKSRPRLDLNLTPRAMDHACLVIPLCVSRAEVNVSIRRVHANINAIKRMSG